MPEILVILFVPAVVALMAVTFVIGVSTVGRPPRVADAQTRLTAQNGLGAGDEIS